MDNLDNYLHIQVSHLKPKNGKILLAEPLLDDLFFSRSVVYIVDYSKEKGTFALNLNKQTRFTVKDFVPELSHVDIPVYWGGPMDNGTLFFLHTLGKEIPSSQKVIKNIYCGGNWEQVLIFLNEGILNESNFKVFTGYAGWEKDQLERELEINSWAIAEISSQTLFSQIERKYWEKAVKSLGNKYAAWLKLPISPNMN